MPKQISINIGFITNSSSVVHHFPKKVLEDPQVKTFMEKMEIDDGFIGSYLWGRGSCASFAVTEEQKLRCQTELSGEFDWAGPAIDVEGESVVVIYGDEYPSIASELCHILRNAVERMGLEGDYCEDYN